MNHSLADRVSRIKPSATLAITARANQIRAEGRDILSLAAGEPDFDTPGHVKEAAIAAIREGKTKYTAVAGTPSLKDAVISKFRNDNGLEYSPNEVMISCGAKQVIYNLCQALLNDADEVIIPAPYWVSYPDIVLLAGGRPVIVTGRSENQNKITAEDLERSISDRTRLLVLNSPSNPTGIAYTRDELGALGEVLERYPQVFVISDDIYEHIMFRGQEFSNILNTTPSLADRTLVLNGVSKAYSMTGWRIGYAGGPEALIKSMTKIQSQSTSNPSSISQAAAEAALTGDQGFVATMREEFEKRHDFMVGALNEIEGIRCPLSDGTFYCFPNIEGLIERTAGISDDLGFVEHLLNEAGMAVVPGKAFGSPGHMRISFATSMGVLEEAATRFNTL